LPDKAAGVKLIVMKYDNEQQSIKKNINWFKKFSLEKRLEIAFRHMQAAKILKGLRKKHATK
jgi:hypothetical protein